MKNKVEKLTKAQLIELIKKGGHFKRDAVKVMYGRENGHLYYTQPPQFGDGFETFKITRKDVEGENVEYPMNGKDTAAAIKACENAEDLKALYASGKLLKEDSRAGVKKALEAQKK